MMRYRVKASRRTPTWFHAVEVSFVDAESAADAKAQIETDPQLSVWAVTESTPAMEATYREWVRKCEAWRVAARTGSAHRGML